MAQIAAVVAWGRGAESGLRTGDLAEVLGNGAAESLRVERAPGADLGWATKATGGESHRHLHLLVDENAKLAVVADCRFDNRDELRALLEVNRDAGDAILLLRAYEVWGSHFPSRLKGDFAGVVWDWGRQRLLGFRDQLGIRPLFYSLLPGGIAVATEVEVLLSLAGGGGSPDDHLIVEHLTWDYHSTERTFWTRLRRLHAGHAFTASPEGVEVRRYWAPPVHELPPLTTEALHEQFRALFFQSVRRRLDPHAPMLAHLSGGIDSSAIVCVADSIYRQSVNPMQPLRAVSARYPGLECDEGSYIEAVTQAIALPSESWDGRSDEFPDLDAPSVAGPGLRSHRADGSSGEFVIARRIGARVILSGLGGDHLGAAFGVGEDRARRRPAWFAWQTLVRSDLTPGQRARRARFLLRSIAPDPLRHLIAAFRGRRRAPDWLQPRWRDLAGDLAAEWSRRSHDLFRSSIQEARWRELTGARLGRSLDADHRCSSGQGVEMRYPFLDEELVSFILSLPAENWPSSEHHFRLHRAALAEFLPVVVRNRTTKADFSHVVAHRIRLAAHRLRKLFFGEHWASERWVKRRPAQRLLERALSGAAADLDWANWQAVRAIGALEAWLRPIFGYDSGGRDSGQGADR